VDQGRTNAAERSGEDGSRRRRRAFGRFGVAPLVVLVVAAVAVACGSVADEPFGIGDSVSDASALATATATATATVTATATKDAAPSASGTADAATFGDAGSDPIVDCPTDYANLETFLNTTACGNCAGSKCTGLADSCFHDCTCIAGALAVFQCTQYATNVTSCTSLAVNIPAQYQSDTFVCAMICEATCTDQVVADSGTSDPLTDSGTDAGKEAGH
jgi:hypothetical protein